MQRFNAAMGVLDELGTTVETVSLLHAKFSAATHLTIAAAAASTNLARFDGERYGVRAEGNDLDKSSAFWLEK